jgi:mannose-P-dolichol utilization defect protein 1
MLHAQYGETVFITLQNAVIIALILGYARRHILNGLVMMLLTSANWALHTPDTVTMAHLAWFQAATIPVAILSKIPQIVANFRQGHTGQLSAFTVFLYFAGSMARIFTTIQEVDDPMILWGFLIATGLNAVLALQMVLYWKRSADKKIKRKKQ